MSFQQIEQNTSRRDVSKIGRWGNGDYEVVMKNDYNIEYIASVAKQAFNILK
jgi:predicted transport protein